MYKHELVINGEKNILKNLAVCLFLSGFFAVFYYETVLSLYTLHSDYMSNFFIQIVNGDADSPYNYRLLVPFLFTFIDSISPLKSNHDYFISTVLIFLFSIAMLMKAISFKTSDRSSIVSLLFASFFILLTFPMAGAHLWSYVDIGLYSLAYIAMIRMWNTPTYVAILLIAVLNRETGILLSVVPLFVGLIRNRFELSFVRYKKEIFILVCGLIFFLAIRVFQGEAPDAITVDEVFSQNFSPRTFIMNIFVYAGALLWLFIGNVVKLNDVEKAFFGILLINIVLILFFGLFREIRMFVPYAFLFGIICARRTD